MVLKLFKPIRSVFYLNTVYDIMLIIHRHSFFPPEFGTVAHHAMQSEKVQLSQAKGIS